MFFSTQQQKTIASLEQQISLLKKENHYLKRANEWNLVDKILPNLDLNLPDDQRMIKCIVGLSDNSTQEAFFCCDKGGRNCWWTDMDGQVLIGRKVLIWRVMPSFPANIAQLY